MCSASPVWTFFHASSRMRVRPPAGLETRACARPSQEQAGAAPGSSYRSPRTSDVTDRLGYGGGRRRFELRLPRRPGRTGVVEDLRMALRGGVDTSVWLREAAPRLEYPRPGEQASPSCLRRRSGVRCSAALSSRSGRRRSRRKAGRTDHPGKAARGPVRSSR